MGEETTGMLSLIFPVSRVVRSISRGSSSLLPGRRMKSRKVYTLAAPFSFVRELCGKVSLPMVVGGGRIISIGFVFLLIRVKARVWRGHHPGGSNIHPMRVCL